VLRRLTGLIDRLQDQLLMDSSMPAPTAAHWIIRVIDGLNLQVADDDFDPAAESALLNLSLRRTLQTARLSASASDNWSGWQPRRDPARLNPLP
jgi:hypothetical protein